MAGFLQIKTDRVGEIEKLIKSLTKSEVLIGVPSDRTDRKDSEPINNAEIGYINEFGAPEANIPPRPHLIPGIRSAQDNITNALKAGMLKTLKGDKTAGHDALTKAGIIGENSVKRKISEGLEPPLSPKTIANRSRQRGAKSMRKGEKEYFNLLARGKTPGQAQEETGIKALINTGEYRRSITHAIRPKGK